MPKPSLKFLRRLPPWGRALLFVLVFGLMAGGAYFLFFQPLYQQIDQLRAQIRELDGKIQEAQRTIAAFNPVTDQERQSWKEVEEALNSLFPPEDQIPRLVFDIYDAAMRSGVGAGDFTFNSNLGGTAQPTPTNVQPPANPGSEASAAPVAAASPPLAGITRRDIRFEISMRADFQNLALFLNEIAKLPRFLEVQSLSIDRAIPLVTIKVILNAAYQAS